MQTHDCLVDAAHAPYLTIGAGAEHMTAQEVAQCDALTARMRDNCGAGAWEFVDDGGCWTGFCAVTGNATHDGMIAVWCVFGITELADLLAGVPSADVRAECMAEMDRDRLLTALKAIQANPNDPRAHRGALDALQGR